MKIFTPESATPTLSLVRRIAEDMVELYATLEMRRRRRMQPELASTHLTLSTAHAEEIAEIRRSLHADQQRMDEMQRELERLGAHVHSASLGAIDFPAMLDNRPVRLCWRPGETTVCHWHEVGEPLEARRPVNAEQFQSAPGV